MDKISYQTTSSQSISLIAADYKKFAFQRHYHLDFHIGLITQGLQKFHHKGSSHKVGNGQIVIMPPDELHDGYAMFESGYQSRVFSIEPHWFSEMADLKQNGQIISFNQLIISDPGLFSQLVNLHNLLMSQNVSQLMKDCLPLEGFHRLFDRFGSQRRAKPIPLGNKSVEILKEYLLANLDQPVQLKQLSDLCDLSPTQFQRHFKARMSITPYAWLTCLRLEHSMKLLKSGVCSTEAAYQVGYYDQAHFSKAFKHCYGISPSQIKRAI
jgi:AraC-like DNA-binding protein